VCLDLGNKTRTFLDALRVGAFLVDFVHRYYQRDPGGPRVRHRFLCLRPYSVIRGDDHNGDVRDPRAARAHRAEGFVPGRV
jgi:hypothetical protein